MIVLRMLFPGVGAADLDGVLVSGQVVRRRLWVVSSCLVRWLG